MHVGGIGGRWEHCISGDFFLEVGDLVDASKAGQVAVSPAIWNMLPQTAYEEMQVQSLELKKTKAGPSREASRSSSRSPSRSSSRRPPQRLSRVRSRNTALSRQNSLSSAHSPRASSPAESSSGSGSTAHRTAIDLDHALATGEAGQAISGIVVDSDEENDLVAPLPPQAYLVTFKDPSYANSVGSNLFSQRFKTLLEEAPTKTTFLDRDVQQYLGRYVQPFVRNALDNGEAGQMAEMRLVSTMFCHLPPFERVGIVVYQQVLTALQLLLSIHDGVLRQFITDDKGTVMIACFGLPGTSSLRRGQRALLTAFSLCIDMSQIVDIHVGVSSGMAFCGNVGSASRCEYCMVGDSVNMAARLMGVAIKRNVQVVCCDETQADAADDFAFDQGEPTVVKGRTLPIKVFRVLSLIEADSASDTSKRSHLVGRQGEVDFIWHIVTSPRTANVCLSLSAAMGQGKTALMQVVHNSAEAYGIETFFAKAASSVASRQSDSGGEGVIFDVMRQWLATLVRGRTTAHALKGLLSPALRDKVYCLAGIKNLLPESLVDALRKDQRLVHGHAVSSGFVVTSGRPASPEEKDLMNDAMDVLVDIISRVVRRKFPKSLFMIDDIDYVDPISWEVIKRVYSQTSKFCLIISYGGRGSRSNDEWANMDAHSISASTSLSKKSELELPLDNCPVQIEYRITPLKQKQTAKLILHTIMNGGVEASLDAEVILRLQEDNLDINEDFVTFQDFVFSRSGGNPLFAIELVHFALRQHILTVRNGEFHLNIEEGQTLETLCSKSIADVVTSRLDHSSPGGRLLLKTASVIGSKFTVDMLEAMLEGHEKVPLLPLYVRELVSRNFWKITAPGHYEFTHKSVQEVIYSMLTVAQRQEMHYAYANHLRTSETGDPASLAFHYSRSSNAVEAIEYILAHGQQLSYLGKNMECARQMESGIQLTNDLMGLVIDHGDASGVCSDARVITTVQIRMTTLLVQSRLTMGSSTAGTLGEEERMTQLRDAAVQLEALMVQGEKYHIEAEIMSPVHSAYFIVKGALRTHRSTPEAEKELIEVADRFIAVAGRCKEKFHLLKALDASSQLRIESGDYKGTVDTLKRAKEIYSSHPGVGPRIVAHYGSDWGMWATTKYITQLLFQGKMQEFCEERARWREAASTVTHAFTQQLMATAEANWMFILGKQMRLQEVIGDIEERSRKLKTSFGDHWATRILHFWANEGRQRNNTPLADPVQEFDTVYRPQLGGRSWWVGAGVSLAAMWTEGCLQNKNIDFKASIQAIEAIGGPHDAKSGYLTPLLVVLASAVHLAKESPLSEPAIEAHVAAIQARRRCLLNEWMCRAMLRMFLLLSVQQNNCFSGACVCRRHCLRLDATD
eukprot:INCI13426.3.p1 GENE.INCI13426.3~~INCI13426.3.p1  ORF type:complete len:1489 (+),score=265.33 INCI13426.3:383-4468(+)